MATQNKFVVEYGVSVGTTEVINSSGKIVAAAISDLTTDNLAEGSAKYYANSLVDTHLSDASTSKTLANVQIDGGPL